MQHSSFRVAAMLCACAGACSADSAERIAGTGSEEHSEAETGEPDAVLLGETEWIAEFDLYPNVLEATPAGVIVGGMRLIGIDREWPTAEAEVLALDADGARVWTSVWDPEGKPPTSIQALAWDEQGTWVAFDDVVECLDWCANSTLARLDATGVEQWRIELSDNTNSAEIRTLDGDVIVVGAGAGPQDSNTGAELRRIGPSGELVWEWAVEGEDPWLYTTGVELYEGALWVVGQQQFATEPTQPWIARLDPDSGALLELVDTPLTSGAAWSADRLPTGLAVITDGRLWVLDDVGDWVWTRGLPPLADADIYPLRCWFDARADGLSATTCGSLATLLDPDGTPLWSWEPEAISDWRDVALGEHLYLATVVPNPSAGQPLGRVYALKPG